MTRIRIVKAQCYICDTQYESQEVLSWNSYMGEPRSKLNSCPTCGAPYRSSIKADEGNARVLLAKYSLREDWREIREYLSQCCATAEEVKQWQDAVLNLDIRRYIHQEEQTLSELRELIEVEKFEEIGARSAVSAEARKLLGDLEELSKIGFEDNGGTLHWTQSTQFDSWEDYLQAKKKQFEEKKSGLLRLIESYCSENLEFYRQCEKTSQDLAFREEFSQLCSEISEQIKTENAKYRSCEGYYMN